MWFLSCDVHLPLDPLTKSLVCLFDTATKPTTAAPTAFAPPTPKQPLVTGATGPLRTSGSRDTPRTIGTIRAPTTDLPMPHGAGGC